jgi:hypothetical protein
MEHRRHLADKDFLERGDAMELHRKIRVALFVLTIAVVAFHGREASATAFSTDASDLWWNPNESGWGMQVVQTASTIFVTMFVYDQNSNPIWYSSTGVWQDNYVWTGDLYQTSGPWFGTAPFDPGAVTRTKVGTLTFAASSSVIQATVTYSVNGVVVTKAIQRQTLTNDNFGGTYQGMFKQVVTCADATKNGTFDVPAVLTIAHSGGAAFTLVATEQSGTCTYTGGYAQYGRMGQVLTRATYSCTDGTAGTFQLFEMNVNITGFSSRGTVQNANCSATFHLGGVRE